MSNHIKGNWFVSVFQMYYMSNQELVKIARSENYRETTRRNAENELNCRQTGGGEFDKRKPTHSPHESYQGWA